MQRQRSHAGEVISSLAIESCHRHEAPMITDLRRSKRFPDYLPVILHAKHGPSGTLLAGPFHGHLINISRHGACILLSQVMVDRFHVFHSTREDDNRLLVLDFDLPAAEGTKSLPARPIWFDRFIHARIKAFKMGLDFLISPDGEEMAEIFTALRKEQPKRARWWTTVVKGTTA